MPRTDAGGGHHRTAGDGHHRHARAGGRRHGGGAVRAAAGLDRDRRGLPHRRGSDSGIVGAGGSRGGGALHAGGELPDRDRRAGGAVRAAAHGCASGSRRARGEFRGVEEDQARQRRQEPASGVSGRCRNRRGLEHRRGNHHLQLRRRAEAPDAHRRARVYRQQFDAGGAGGDRAGQLRGRRERDHRGCSGASVGAGARAAGDQAGLEEEKSRPVKETANEREGARAYFCFLLGRTITRIAVSPSSPET